MILADLDPNQPNCDSYAPLLTCVTDIGAKVNCVIDFMMVSRRCYIIQFRFTDVLSPPPPFSYLHINLGPGSILVIKIKIKLSYFFIRK